MTERPTLQVKEQRPPVPRLVFAEEVERVIQQKRSDRDSANKSASARDSGRKKGQLESDRDKPGNTSDPRTSGSRKHHKDKIDEALRSSQWNGGGGDWDNEPRSYSGGRSRIYQADPVQSGQWISDGPDSNNNSGGRRSDRDKIGDALRSGNWTSDPAVLNAVHSTEDLLPLGSARTSNHNLSKNVADNPSFSLKSSQHMSKIVADNLQSASPPGPPPSKIPQDFSEITPDNLPPPTVPPAPPLPVAVSLSINQTEIYRAETDTAILRSTRSGTPKPTARIDHSLYPPSLDPIPQVVPRIVHEPERQEEHAEPADPLPPPATPSPFNTRKITKTIFLILSLFIIPIACVLGFVNIPLAQLSAGLSGNLVYLLVYYPLWGLSTSLAMFLFLLRQLRTQHPDMDNPKLLWSILTVLSQAITMPLAYFIISIATQRFPLPFGTFVVVPVALVFFFILVYFTIADSEQRNMPGFLKNFLVNILVLVILELHRLVIVAFVFFFPQLDNVLQMLIGFSFHTLVFALRWAINIMVDRLVYKGRSINQYHFTGVGEDRGTRKITSSTNTRDAG